jgi:RimJ/RimL family protein N-acetyltransferase
MLITNFNPFPVIATNRLLLRKIDPSDVNEIFFLRSDARVMKYIDKAPAKSPDEAMQHINLILDLEKNNEAVEWAITLKEDTKLIGTICFWNIQKDHFRAEIGYALHPDYHGKGIMQEAMSKVLDYGFNIMKLHSVEANVNPGNAASIKLLERNKFIREAYFRENYFYDGNFLDSAIYSLLITQWRQE